MEYDKVGTFAHMTVDENAFKNTDFVANKKGSPGNKKITELNQIISA